MTLTVEIYSSAHLATVWPLVPGFCAEKKMDQDQINALQARLKTAIILTVKDDDKVIGIAPFQYDKPARRIFCLFSYVMPGYRDSRFIYGRLAKEMLRCGKKLNVKKVEFFVTREDFDALYSGRGVELEGYIMSRRV